MTTKKTRASIEAADPVEAARAEVVRLNDQELKFALLFREGSAALAGIRAKRGRQVLDANDPSGAAAEINQRIRAVEDEQAAMAEAAAEARRARLPAIAAFIAAESDAKDRRAAELDQEAARLEGESDVLRAALEAATGWGWVPAAAKIDGNFVARIPDGGGQFRVVDVGGPRHARLRAEAESLRVQAAQGRYRQPHQAGGVEAATLEELLAALYSDPMRISPPADSIASWAEQATEKERRRRTRFDSSSDAFTPAGAPMKLYMEWRGGVIDQAQSRIMPAAAGIRANADSPETIATLGPLSDATADPYQQIEREAAAIPAEISGGVK